MRKTAKGTAVGANNKPGSIPDGGPLVNGDFVELLLRERQRIGRDLHDTMGQQLTGIAYFLDVLRREVSAVSPELAGRVSEIAVLIRNLSREMSAIVRGLSEPETRAVDLGQALRRLAAETRGMGGVACRCTVRGMAGLDGSACMGHLLRIAREATHNALRHSGANMIDISLRGGKRSGVLRVADDGCGLPQDVPRLNRGLGLCTMRYRADVIGGRLSLESAPGAGTIVTCRFPLPAQGPTESRSPVTGQS